MTDFKDTIDKRFQKMSIMADENNIGQHFTILSEGSISGPNIAQHGGTSDLQDLETSQTWAVKSREWATSDSLVDDLDYSSQLVASYGRCLLIIDFDRNS